MLFSAVGTPLYEFGCSIPVNCEMQFVLDFCRKLAGCRGIPVVIDACGIYVGDLLVEPSLAEADLPDLPE